jgi:nucleotide-binding universal stress UspA family protein
LAPVFRGPLRVQMLEGLVPETLTQEVAERGADLVVMNAHGWGYVSRALIGSVSDYLMRHLNVPLLLMHSDRPPSDLTTEVACQRGLVCLDGSELSEAILPSALAIGRQWKSHFRLLRIVAPSYGWVQAQMAPADDQQVDQATTAASTYLDVVAQPIRAASLRVETRVLTSRNIAADILHDADASRCDWIAISTHGRGGLSRLLLGSVADKVVRGAHTPVLVYHPAA